MHVSAHLALVWWLALSRALAPASSTTNKTDDRGFKQLIIGKLYDHDKCKIALSELGGSRALSITIVNCSVSKSVGNEWFTFPVVYTFRRGLFIIIFVVPLIGIWTLSPLVDVIFILRYALRYNSNNMNWMSERSEHILLLGVTNNHFLCVCTSYLAIKREDQF